MRKKMNLSRRNFVKRAGMLVSALGVGGGLQSGLMDNIVRRATKKWGGEAIAAEPNAVHFCVEILLRAGFQFNSLFATAGHMTDTRGPDLNFYSSRQNVVPVTVNGRNLYYPRFTAGDGMDALMSQASITSGRLGVAASEAIVQDNDNHTNLWMTRAPSSMTPSPANLHAMVAPPADVQGVEWNNGIDTMNQGGKAFSLVRGPGDFLGLYKDVPMFFTQDELKLVVGEISKGQIVNGKKGAIGTLDDMFLARNVPGAPEFAEVSLAGRGQAQLSLASQLDITNIRGNFTNIDQSMGGTQLGIALAHAAKAFGIGAMTTLTVSLDSNDWHTDVPTTLDDVTSKQAAWNSYLGNQLAGFIKTIEAIPDPFDVTKSIVDSILISISSEFSRTPNRLGGADNGDGGAQAFAFLGSKVRTGTFGNITGAGAIQSFDPSTGALANATLNGAMVWKATGALLGVSDATLSTYVPGAGIPILLK